jgi:sugar/nucleoside kinase (ribokinase family)
VSLAVFLGLATIDIIFGVDAVPGENQKIVARRLEILGGGPATNAAITYAFLGGSATLVASVGMHPLADVIRSDLAQFRISLQDLTPDSYEIPTVASILISQASGARTVVSSYARCQPAAAEAFDVSELESARVLLVDGHQMTCAIAAAARAKALGIPVVLDGGSWKHRTDELLAHTQIAICSEDFKPPGTTSLLDVIAYVRNLGVSAVAITRGPKSIIWATEQSNGELPVPSVLSVDTLGAGDIFHGAFCHRLVSGAAFPDALAFAAKVAAYSCEFAGTRAWMNSWASETSTNLPGETPHPSRAGS